MAAMEPSRWKQAEALFHEVLDCGVQDRASRLGELDAELRQEVLGLLDAYDASEAVPAATAAPEKTPRRIGPYTLGASLGEGGMGAVYLAERADAHFEKRVAIKLIRPGPGSALLIRRFQTERQILAGMEHPNIARLLDGGITPDGQPYLAMDYVDGVRLDKYCDQRKLTLADRLRLLVKICAAVHYAHQSLVVHRDLKPNNILVTTDGEPKLLDFGVAKVVQAGHDDIEQTATVGLFFTPLYASPEILRGQHTTTSTDVYSLGVILYQLLTGRVPHEELSLRPGDLLNAIITSDPALPSASPGQELPGEAGAVELAALRGETPEKLARALRGDLDAIAMRALGKTPAERYGSAGQLAEDIERYLDKKPVLARQQTFVYRATKFARRRWKGLLAAAAAVVLVGAASAYAIREQWRAAQRFEETRAIAKYLLFDLFDQISRLPGSTGARARMAQRAQTELDHLALLARNNREVQMETARGYHRLAQIYGVPGGPNLGDTALAAANLERARAILTPLRQQSRAPEVELAWAENLLGRAAMEMWVNGKTAAAQPLVAEAARIVEATGRHDTEWLRTRARLRDRQAELAGFESQPEGEWKYAQIGLRELAEWPAALQQEEEHPLSRARMLRAAGNGLYYRDDVLGALALYQEEDSLLLAVNARLPNRPAVLTGLMLARYDVATTLDKLGRRSEALQALSRSLETGRQLLQIEDRDQTLRRNIFVERMAYAEMLTGAGRPAEATREMEAVVAERRLQVAHKPGVPQRERDLAFSLFVLGKTCWNQDRARACQLMGDALNQYERLHQQGAITAWDWEQNANNARQLLKQCPVH